MEPLKEMFNPAFYREFANTFRSTYHAFDADAFYEEITHGLNDLELNQRLRKTSRTLYKYLPPDFSRAIEILEKAAPALKQGYTALVLPDYVAQFGKNNPDRSLKALKFFTRFGSSEFAIREFIRLNPEATLREMNKWAEDENHHVRRLASEGSRPRLPWSFRLDEIIRHPKLTKSILEKLNADDHAYVRKSVANHLNDISKDNPDYMLKLVGSWNLENKHTAWIVKHACRSLIKKGDSGTLSIFSFERQPKVELIEFSLEKKKLSLGDSLLIRLRIKSKKPVPQKLVIDYAITYARASGKSARKVFKFKEFTLNPGETKTLTRKQIIKNFTTRTHHHGDHLIELLVNGVKTAEVSFHLRIPSAISKSL